MKTRKLTQKQEMERLIKENEALRADNAHLVQQVDWLSEKLGLLNRNKYGQSSEKSEYDQIDLFNEAESYANIQAAEPELSKVEAHYRKRRRAMDQLPEDLPVEVVEHILSADEQDCPVCGNPMHVIGRKVVRRELKLIPARAVIVEHVQLTYGCRPCERTGTSVPIIKAPLPEPVIKGSFATPESVALMMTDKFVMGIPLYRQEQQWKRQGIQINRQTMSNWLIRAATDWLLPIYNALKVRLVAHELLHGDETVLQVLREPGRPAESASYMWLYRTSGDALSPIILLEYQPGRKAEYPQAFLEGFSGYLHTDGFSAYRILEPTVTVVGCWSHARRGYDKALKLLKPEVRAGTGPHIGKGYCDRLFAIERELAELTPDERYIKRQELAKPVLDEFLAWLNQQSHHTTKNAFGKAVHYTLNQWKYLKRYLLDGRLELSNNRAERSIKPFVIDRKNFLFAVSPAGATSSAIIFSIIETAKENGLNPYEYLTFLLREMPGRSDDNLDALLPDSPLLPENCFAPQTRKPDLLAWDEK